MTKNFKVFYIYANNATIKTRLSKRGDSEEANRRLTSDEKDFKDVEVLADRIFYNNEGTAAEDIVKRIVTFRVMNRNHR